MKQQTDQFFHFQAISKILYANSMKKVNNQCLSIWKKTRGKKGVLKIKKTATETYCQNFCLKVVAYWKIPIITAPEKFLCV